MPVPLNRCLQVRVVLEDLVVVAQELGLAVLVVLAVRQAVDLVALE